MDDAKPEGSGDNATCIDPIEGAIVSAPSKKSRVLEYGLLPPVVSARLVHDQMRLGHLYRNKLVEIEIEIRKDRGNKCCDARDCGAVGHLLTSSLDLRLNLCGWRFPARKRQRRGHKAHAVQENVNTVSG